MRTYHTGTTGEYPNEERISLKREVHGLLENAGIEDWDDEGVLALAPETADLAQKLIDEFPPHIGRPDIAATPHGEVDFDWVIDRDVMLTVSVGPSKEIAFAGLFQGTRLNGCEPWKGTLPQVVNYCFERLCETQNL